MLVSPAEPNIFHSLGTLSWLPELRGCDFAWRARGSWFGIQRKRIDDFVASMMDGRLSKEVAQMKGEGDLDGVVLPMLVLEGTARFTAEGHLMLNHHAPHITRDQLEGRMFSLAMNGVHVFTTRDANDTKEWIARYEKWTRKAKHSSNSTRPGPVSPWGTASSTDWSLHTLQSFPGLGVDRAQAVLDTFGRLPLRWDVTEMEMMQVKGLGKKTVRAMYGAFE